MTHALKTAAFALVLVAAVAFASVLATPQDAATFPFGSTGGFAGNNSDPDPLGNVVVRTCADRSCHASFPLNSGTGSVSIDAPSSVQPGETVTITVTVDNTTPAAPGSATGPRQGFEVAIRDEANNAGTFTITQAETSRLLFGSDPGVTHTVGGTLVPSWSFDWTAPMTPGLVTIYAAGNAADGNGNNIGDYIYSTTEMVAVGSTTSSETATPQVSLELGAPHPNPVRTGATSVRLTLPDAGAVRVRLVDGRGRTVRRVVDERRGAGESHIVVQTDGLAPGLYFVVAEALGRKTVQPVSVVR